MLNFLNLTAVVGNCNHHLLKVLLQVHIYGKISCDGLSHFPSFFLKLCSIFVLSPRPDGENLLSLRGDSARHGRRASSSAGNSPHSPLSPNKFRNDLRLGAESTRRERLRGIRADWDKLSLQDLWDKPNRSRWLHSLRSGKSVEDDRTDQLTLARNSWASRSAEVDDRRLVPAELDTFHQPSYAQQALEESWNVLHTFNQKQRGRLTITATHQGLLILFFLVINPFLFSI